MKNRFMVIAVVIVSVVVLILGFTLVRKLNEEKIGTSNSKFDSFYLQSSAVESKENETESTPEALQSNEAYEKIETTVVEVNGTLPDPTPFPTIYSESGFKKENVSSVGGFNVMDMANSDKMIEDCYPIYGEVLYSKFEEMNKQYTDCMNSFGRLVIPETVRLEKEDTYWQINCRLTDGEDVFLTAIRTTEPLEEGVDVFGDERTFNKGDSN